MIPSSNSSQDPNVKTFFETHNSTKAYTLPGLTEEKLTKLQSQIESILTQSPVLVHVLSIKGLTSHRASMNTLLACLYHIKCKQCKTSPVVFEAAVYHPGGVVFVFEDRSIYSHPPENQAWPVPEGFHASLNCRCPTCNDTFFCIATYLPEVGRLINSYAKEIGKMKDPNEKMGFVTKSSWITTYFKKKAIDKRFAQKTALACITCYRELKQACFTRQLPEESFHEEFPGVFLDVIRNLIPQLRTELEFCGLIRGAYLFTMMYMGDRKYHFSQLDPFTTPFSFSKLQQEFRSYVGNLSYEQKKMCLASAILTVDTAYQCVTPSNIALPKWVTPYRGLI